MKGNKATYLERGRELITELNRIRKDPKSIVSSLNYDLQEFKQDKTLVKDNVVIKTKEGKAGYIDLINEIEQQYPIPGLKISEGLCIACAEQVIQLQRNQQNQGENLTNYLVLIKKFCTSNDGISNIIMNRSEDDNYLNMITLLLVGDGDPKRLARRKLMNPSLKVIGAAVGETYFVINIGESAKDNKQMIQQAFHKSPIKNYSKDIPKQISKEVNSPYKSSQDERIIKKKTTKSTTLVRNGKHYKQTTTKILYADGETEEIQEQQLIQ